MQYTTSSDQKYIDRRSTLILLGKSERSEQSLNDYAVIYADSVGAFEERHPLELHLAFIDLALASWRPYLADLLSNTTSVVSPPNTSPLKLLRHILVKSSAWSQKSLEKM